MAEVAAITAVITQAIEIGADLIAETGSRLDGLKENIEWIERKMRHFKSCLKDAESKRDRSHEVANLINEMRDLALDIQDMLDTYLPEIASHKGNEPFRFVKHAARILCYGATAKTFALEIEKIKRRAQDIEATRQRCLINLDTDGGNTNTDVWDRRKRFLVSPESTFVGRIDTLQELKKKLRSPKSECEMICIVGDAGVGKTTVGKKIYAEMRNEFTYSALVYVSNEPRVHELLLEIAKQVGLEEEKRKDDLEVNLRSMLNEKRCLIFLDDIWKTEAWDELKNVIPIDSRNGSRIIVTSRFTPVGRYIGGEDERSLIELKLLDKEKSWELFSKLIKSSSENTNERFPWIELEDIARKIVERCGGLPLAIEVAVGMLRQRRRNKREWNMVLDSLSTSAENDCSKILSLSYSDLPPDLRPFFLYFGLFPEDQEISASELVMAWVAEKFIQVDGIRNPDDIGVAKLEMLSDRNLIQVSKRNLDGSIKSCRIHDLQRVLCIDISKKNNFFGICHEIHTGSFSTLRRLTVDTSQCSFQNSKTPFFLSNSRTPKLRSLLYHSCDTLIMPDEIGNLSSLTYLNLSGSFVRMPSTIKNLKKLVTLDISQAYFDYSPTIILRMRCLRHLLVGSFSSFKKSNKCIILFKEKEIDLPNIETFVADDRIVSLKASSLQKLSNLRKLSIHATDQHIDVLSGTTPISEKLQYLRLSFYEKFERRLKLSHYDHLAELHLQSWMYPLIIGTIEFPPNLVSLTFKYWILTDDPMKMLKGLPRLEILRLKSCRYVGSFTLDFSGANSFPELQVLAILKTYNAQVIPELIVDQTGMPKLYQFVCSKNSDEELNVPERLRKIMVVKLRKLVTKRSMRFKPPKRGG